jgi:hypothetical protein
MENFEMAPFLKTIIFSALIGLGLSSMPSSAKELGGEQRDYRNGNSTIHCGHNRCRPHDGDWGQHNWPRPRHGWNVHPGVGFGLYFGDNYPRRVIRPARFCSDGMAVSKARSIGIRNIKAYAYRDHVLIKGTKRGHRIQVAFSRSYGCPTIRY